MSITTEEAERLAAVFDRRGPTGGASINGVIYGTIAAAFRSLAAERDALKAKVDGVYSERNRLAAAFARMALAAGFKAGKGVDPDETKWPVVYVETPNGQVSWHIASRDADILKGLPDYEGQWDKTWRARYADWCRWPRKARRAKARDKDFAELQAENARLRAALKFYGDVSKYPSPLTGGMGALWSDCGQIARATLGEKDNAQV